MLKTVLVPDPSGFTKVEAGVHYESLMEFDAAAVVSTETMDPPTLKKRGPDGFTFIMNGVHSESPGSVVVPFAPVTPAFHGAGSTYALDILEGKKTLFVCDDAQELRVEALIRNIKIFRQQNADLTYARDVCRSKMMGLVTAYNLPFLFITLILVLAQCRGLRSFRFGHTTPEDT
jgi:hypothetical protein